MILQVVSINHFPGKNEEAEKQMLKFAAYVNQKLSGGDLQILRNFEGLTHQMHFVSTHESISAWEAEWNALRADSGFQDLLAEGQEIYDSSSIDRHFFQVVE